MKVSVIVPVYNVSVYIAACIDSLQAQTYRNLEIILVNDGSQDDSGEIIERYARTDSRIVVITKPNGGLSDARNHGLAQANGELIAFVDGDDLLEPDTIAGNISYFQENPHLDMLQYPIIDYYSTSRAEKRILGNKLIENEKVIPSWFENNLISYSVCNKLFRKSSIEGCLFPKNMVFEDAFFCCEIATRITHIRITDKGSYCYRYRENSITSSAVSYFRYKCLLQVQRNWYEIARTVSDPQALFGYSLRTIWTHILYTNRWTRKERTEVFGQLSVFCNFSDQASIFIRACSLKHKLLFASLKIVGLRATARVASTVFLLTGK